MYLDPQLEHRVVSQLLAERREQADQYRLARLATGGRRRAPWLQSLLNRPHRLVRRLRSSAAG